MRGVGMSIDWAVALVGVTKNAQLTARHSGFRRWRYPGSTVPCSWNKNEGASSHFMSLATQEPVSPFQEREVEDEQLPLPSETRLLALLVHGTSSWLEMIPRS